MKDTSQIQSVESLRLNLYARPLHPELFDIYDDVRIRRRGYEASIWVTGCTHVVGFYSEDHSLSEVVADDRPPLPLRGQIFSIPIRGEKSRRHHHTMGIDYMMTFQVEQMSARVYHRTHHELARQAMRRGRLFVPLPMWMTNGLTPYSYLNYEARDNHLHVMAFHAFPQERTLVKTQSIFELS